MKTGRRLAALMVMCLGVLSLAGCGRSPHANFYTLTSTVKPVVADPARTSPSVAVASISLPELVDRPQFVVPVDGSRVDILEAQRWAEPLKSGIPRLLAENLSGLLGTDRVSAYPQTASNEVDYRVFVDFRRFESTGDAVFIEAFWSIRGQTGTIVKTGRTRIREPYGGKGYEPLVSAYSRALGVVSNDIALSIRREWAASR